MPQRRPAGGSALPCPIRERRNTTPQPRRPPTRPTIRRQSAADPMDCAHRRSRSRARCRRRRTRACWSCRQARRGQAAHDFGVVDRHAVVEDPAAGRGSDARGIDEVFQGDWDAVQRSRQVPRAISPSAVRACASADSPVTVMNAFSAGFSAAMRARQARVISSDDSFRRRSRSATSLRLSSSEPAGAAPTTCAAALVGGSVNNAPADAAPAAEETSDARGDEERRPRRFVGDYGSAATTGWSATIDAIPAMTPRPAIAYPLLHAGTRSVLKRSKSPRRILRAAIAAATAAYPPRLVRWVAVRVRLRTAGPSRRGRARAQDATARCLEA